MICFEIGINGERVTTAGIESEGVLSVYTMRRDVRRQQSLRVHVTALTHQSCHLEWAKRSLEVGDTLTIRVLEQARADEPTERRELVPRPGLSIDESMTIAAEQLEFWRERLRKLGEQKAAGAQKYVPDDEEERRWFGGD